MGLLREDKALTNRFLRSYASVESIRRQIENQTTVRQAVSTSVDLPLSNESKRVLAYAAEEAERLGHKQIGTEHLLLGLLREEKCFAAQMLEERGLRLSRVREQLAHVGHSYGTERGPKPWDLANVTITSVPVGADIQVDDAFLGHTPAQVSLEVGERTVTITKAGHKPWQCRLKLKVLPRSKQTITAELEQVSANT